MWNDFSICVGTTGFGGGVWHSPNGGETWSRIRAPFPLGSQVRGLAVYPDNPHRILAGADTGVYRSEDSGATWEKMWSPMEGMPIWSVAIDPVDTQTIFVGVKPAAFSAPGTEAPAGQSCRYRWLQQCADWPPHGDQADG